MIADICNKISRSGSNLSDRLEDNLTGNFFGSLRYLPFHLGLKPILLQSMYPPEAAEALRKIDCDFWGFNIAFWPYDAEGEMDVLLEFPELVVGIEVKYLSGLSSDDAVGESATWEDSCNQLARQSRMISRKKQQQQKLLVLIAPEPACMRIYQESRERIHPDVAFACASWNDILRALRTIESDSPYERLILTDLKRLLIHKGFEQFKSFGCGVDVEIDPGAAFHFDSTLFSFGQIPNNHIQEDGHYVFGS